MKAWFENLENKQQILVVGIMLILLIALFLTLLRQPLRNKLEITERSLLNSQLSLTAVEEIKDRIQRVDVRQNSIQSGSTQSLSSIINDSLADKRFVLNSMQQLSTDAIQLQINNTEFPTILGWIHELEQTPGVVLDNLNVSALENGNVNITLGLTKAN